MASLMGDVLEEMGKQADKAFRELLIAGAVTVCAVGALGTYGLHKYSQKKQETARYNQAYNIAVNMADKDSSGSLDSAEFAELYRRAGVESVVYVQDKQKVATNKLTLSQLEKAIASYKQ